MALTAPDDGELLGGGEGASSSGPYCFPMTLTQQAFWYLDRVNRGNPAWNIAVRFRVAGRLDPAVLQRAVDALVARQDALRTTFLVGERAPWEDEPAQVVHAAMPVRVVLDDLTQLGPERQAARAEELTCLEGAASFSLERGPLLRVRLLRLGDEEHTLLLTVHHIIADGWSIGILSHELMTFYAAFHANQIPPLEPLPIQFADYAVWKQEHGNGAPAASDRLYWSAKLQKLGKCEIPPDYPRPRQPAHKGHILSMLLPAALTDGLAHCAREHRATLFSAALAVLKLLIYRSTGDPDVYVGTLLAGRDRLELEPLVGVFVNTLVLRTQVAAKMHFAALLASVRETVEQGMEHQAMPFSQLMTQLRLKPHAGCSHFYSINFIFQRDFVQPWQGAGLTVTALPSRSPGAIYDLNFFMVRRADGWRFSCEYDRELYAAETVQLLIEQFVSVLEQVVRDPYLLVSDVILPSALTQTLGADVPGRYVPSLQDA